MFRVLRFKDKSNLIPSILGNVKTILRKPCFHMSSLSHEAKRMISQLQHCLPKSILWDKVILETRLVSTRMILPRLGMLQTKVVHKSHSTP